MDNKIMKEAHRIAKQYLLGDYSARMKEALKMAWNNHKRGYSLELEKETKIVTDYPLYLFGRQKGFWTNMSEYYQSSRHQEVKDLRFQEINGVSPSNYVNSAIADLKNFDVSTKIAKLNNHVNSL